MNYSSDEDDYDFGSENESDEYSSSEPSSPKKLKSSKDDRIREYELVKRDSVYELMNSILTELEKITDIPHVSKTLLEGFRQIMNIF